MALFAAKSYKPYVNLMMSSVQHYCTVVMNKGSVFNATSSLSTLTFTRTSHLPTDHPVSARTLPGTALLQAPNECLPVCFLTL